MDPLCRLRMAQRTRKGRMAASKNQDVQKGKKTNQRMAAASACGGPRAGKKGRRHHQPGCGPVLRCRGDRAARPVAAQGEAVCALARCTSEIAQRRRVIESQRRGTWPGWHNSAPAQHSRAPSAPPRAQRRVRRGGGGGSSGGGVDGMEMHMRAATHVNCARRT